MTPAEIFEKAKNDGVFLSVNGAEKLKVAGAQSAVENWLPVLKKIKTDIIHFLTEKPLQNGIEQVAQVNHDLKPCPLCNGVDFTHGKCGGYFCTECQPGITGQPLTAGGTRPGKSQNKVISIIEPRQQRQAEIKGNATTWLDSHRQELTEAGFTNKDLHGYKWVSGIADLNLWNKPDLRVELRGNVLVFTWISHDKMIQQTCRPEHWRQ